MPLPASQLLGEGQRLLYASNRDAFLIAGSPMVPVKPAIVQHGDSRRGETLRVRLDKATQRYLDCHGPSASADASR